MAVDVLMPVVTEAGEEGVVTAWFVDDAQACKAGQLLAEVQAEKVAEEVTAPEDGFVTDRVAIGDPVPQGEPICRIVESIDAGASETTAAAPATPASGSGVRASPAAKRVARELGVDLTGIEGSGPEGRITEADVRGAASTEQEGMAGLRAVIARNMRRSHAETAPVTLFATADLGPSLPDQLTAVIVKAVAEVLVQHPELSGTRSGDAFTPAATAHISLAIQTDDGLVAPVVRDPASRSVSEIADEIASIAERARSKSLTSVDYEGGTFSVSNLGAYGVEGFTPIINLPQVAILGVGAARKAPAINDDGNVVATHQMALSLTFDHAFVDGAPAAEFLRDVRQSLEP